MNYLFEVVPASSYEQEPSPGSLRTVEQRLDGALMIQLSVLGDATGNVGAEDKDRAQKAFNRISWQQTTIERLRNWKIHEAVSGGAEWDDATEQAANLSASEALTHLETWMEESFDAPGQSDDPALALYHGYAEDLQSKLIDEASRS